jgi:NADH dehydrogenase
MIEARHRTTSRLPRVVIVGAGFGGLACARALGNAPAAVTVVDRRNFHLFVPLLYQVATAALSPADIAQPIRRILSRYRNIEVTMAEVTGVDFARREVIVRDSPPLPYDRLVIAAGSEYAYFGHDHWAAYAPGLKSIEDAQLIRARLLCAFERAELSRDPDEQQAMITTIVVGGGPTGVEMAGSVWELARHALARDFRHVKPGLARVILVEAGPRILAGFPESLANYARERLERLGVEVLTGKAVEDISGGCASRAPFSERAARDMGGETPPLPGPLAVKIAGDWISAGTIVWGAGVQAPPAMRWVPGERDRSGRVIVAPDLSLPGAEGVYVIGDLAHCRDEDGQPLPGLAQVANQQGRHLGRSLASQFSRGTPLPPFRFHDRGNTAIVGRNAAVFDFGGWRLKGFVGWVLWALIHVYLLVGFERRLLVTMQWFWLYITYQRGARLILPGGNGRRRGEAPGDRGG